MRTVRFLLIGLTLSALAVEARDQDPFEVGILADQPPAAVSTLFERMRSEVIAVVGPAAKIRMDEEDIVSNGYDPALAEAHYLTMLEGGTDLIIAFGAVNASVVAGRDSYPKPTILFGGVNRDLLDLPAPGATSGVPNFTYLVSPGSYRDDLRTLKSLCGFKRVGVVTPPGPIDALKLREQLPPLMRELDVDYEIVPYTSPSSVVPALDGVDAVYLLESFLIPEAEIRSLAEVLVNRGIPSFSGERRLDVELGLMATNRPRDSLDTFFRRLALLVEAVIDGEDLSAQPVAFDRHDALTMNFQTARAVGVPIRYSMITSTEFVGELVNPLAERTYSLRELVAEALAANPALESRRRNVRIAEQERRGAWSAYLPNLEASLTQSVVDRELAAAGAGNPQYSTDGRVSVKQTLLSPDAISGISIQNSLLAAERELVRGAEWDLVVEAANIYLNTLILKASLEIRGENLDVSKRNLEIARQSFEAGQTGRGDVLRLESESAQDMQEVVAAIAALQQAYHTINATVNAPVDREIDVVDIALEDGAFSDRNFESLRTTLDDPSLREPFEDWATLEAMANSPELIALDRNIDAAGRDAGRNGLQRFIPTIAAGLDVTRNLDVSGVGAPPAGTGLSEYFTLGIVASVPLFDSNRRRIERQTSLLRGEQLRLERVSAAQSIETSVRNLVQDLTRESANIELSDISERTAAEALELTQAAYASGAVTLVELIDAQRNLLSARLGRASATYTFLATAVGLQRLIGDLAVLGSPEQREAHIQRFLDYLETRPDR